MNPNYTEMMRRQQEDYQRSRNPFEYGQQVARRRYSEIMSGLDAQRQAVSRSYGDMYQAARQRAVGAQAMGGPTLSGGLGQQRRDYVSALEMQELGKIGGARQQAEADLYAQSQAAFSNAQLEGQQAAQTELTNRQQALQLVQTKQAIMDDGNLTDAQKQEQLEALEGGTNPEYVAQKQDGVDQLLIKGGLGFGGLAVAGAGIVKTAKIVGAAKKIIGVGAGVKGGVAAVLAKAKGLGALASLGKAGSWIAGSMALHPVGWTIGAIVAVTVGAGLIISALK